MESMWDEPLSKIDARKFADILIQKMAVSHIELLRDRNKALPFAADERLKVLRQVFDTKREGTAITQNIARAVKPFSIYVDGHETGMPDELERFIGHHGIDSKAVLYLSIQVYTGLRVSDLALLGSQHRSGDEFRLILFKNTNWTPVDLVLLIHPILEDILARHKISALTFLVTEFGKSFSIKGLRNRISDWWWKTGMPHLTSRSVKKGMATDSNGQHDRGHVRVAEL